MNDRASAAVDAGIYPPLSRRGFVIGAAGTGFTLAFAPSALALANPANPVARQLFEPTIWYHIDRDGLITVNIIRAEMGQHVGTAVARILAEELEADWQNVRIDAVDTDPKWGLMITGASWSVWQSFPLYRARACSACPRRPAARVPASCGPGAARSAMRRLSVAAT